MNPTPFPSGSPAPLVLQRSLQATLQAAARRRLHRRVRKAAIPAVVLMTAIAGWIQLLPTPSASPAGTDPVGLHTAGPVAPVSIPAMVRASDPALAGAPVVVRTGDFVRRIQSDGAGQDFPLQIVHSASQPGLRQTAGGSGPGLEARQTAPMVVTTPELLRVRALTDRELLADLGPGAAALCRFPDSPLLLVKLPADATSLQVHP